jgi:hypothetical protein
MGHEMKRIICAVALELLGVYILCGFTGDLDVGEAFFRIFLFLVLTIVAVGILIDPQPDPWRFIN